ncbi:MAG: glycosyltransferase family 2 protein [Rhodospirillaceae bacterium]|nr:glycosyltransferase family 2 protein [Rhodospirillaceae bacterium]
MASPKALDLSIIIATRNRAQSLAKALDSITKLNISFDQIEIIIADNGSRDSTSVVCEMYGNIFPHFKYIFDPRPGQLIGWHRALLEANAEILAFIDDDVRPTPGWAKCALECFESPEIGIATGRIIPEFEQRPPSWQNQMVLENSLGIWSALWGMLDFGTKIKEIPVDFVWGSNFLIRRQGMFDAGGFHPGSMPLELFHFTGDGDVGVGRIIAETGLKALYHPGAAVAHELPAVRNSGTDEVQRWIFGEGLATSYVLMRRLAAAYSTLTTIDLIDLVADTISSTEITNIGRGYLNADSNLPDELEHLFRTCGSKGFRLHQEYFKKDALFRDWVLQPNYLDLDACYTHPDLQSI